MTGKTILGGAKEGRTKPAYHPSTADCVDIPIQAETASNTNIHINNVGMCILLVADCIDITFLIFITHNQGHFCCLTRAYAKFYLFYALCKLCYNIEMYLMSKSLAFLAVLGLLLSGVPALAMSCNHAKEAAPVASAEMPCHKTADDAAPITKTDKSQKSGMDCCGDLCTCA